MPLTDDVPTPLSLLLVEEESRFRDQLERALTSEGYQVLSSDHVRDATALVDERPIDLALIGLEPGMGTDRLALTRWLRGRDDLPVIVLTATDDFEEISGAYESGADECVSKPFSVAVLLLRVRALLRRTGRLRGVLRAGAVVMNETARTVTVGADPVDLSPTEFRLLATLLRNRGRALSKAQLLETVWGHPDLSRNVVEVYVSALRKKLAGAGQLITTVRGFGYRVDP